MTALKNQPDGLAPELELLLLAAVRAGEMERESVVGLIASGLDWDRLFELAAHHRLVSILYTRLASLFTEGDVQAPPLEFMARLRAKGEALNRNNLLLTAELVRLLGLFNAHGIPALPLKGPPLAMKLYGNLALRPFADLDILVPPEHAARASELLAGAGYRPKPELTPAQERAYLHFQHDRTFENKGTGGYLELHWHFFSRYVSFPLEGAGFWDRLPRATVGGAETLELPPEELLIFLAAHGAKHHWASLGWVVDIERLLAAYPALDWRRLRELARRTGTERMTLLALRVAEEYAGAALPEEVTGWMESDRAVEGLRRQVRQVIAAMEGDTLGERREHRFYLETRERLADRVRYYWFWTLTPNARDRALADLPAGLYPLYYLLRPFRMVRRIVR